MSDDQVPKMFTVIASGRTYDRKEELKAHGFRWEPLLKSWKREMASSYDVRQMENMVSDGDWGGIELEVTED